MIARAEAFVVSLHNWWNAFLARLKQKNRWAWLAVFIVAMVVTSIISDRFARAVSGVPEQLAKGTVIVLRAPLWQGGIVVLLFLAVLAGLAYFDSRPARDGAPRLSQADVIEMERAKELWTDETVGASAKLGELLSRAVSHFEEEGNTFASLLYAKVKALSEASGLVGDILSQKKPGSFADLTDALRKLEDEYSLAVCWLNRCTFDDPTFLADKKSHVGKVHEEWRKSHASMVALYAVLAKRTAYEGKIPAGPPPDPSDLQFRHEMIHRENVRGARARFVAHRLNLLTDDESEFLDLFTVENLPMREGQPETWLSNSVWHAGHKLVRDGVLSAVTPRDGVTRFCLPEPTQKAWNNLLGFRKVCIEISGNTVRGSGASGGGAAGRM